MSAAPPEHWQTLGNCNKVAPDTMFPEPTDLVGVKQAKAQCRGCQVVRECLEWALEAGESHGVWGGLDEKERRKLRRSRRRQASAKVLEGAAA